MSFIKDRILIMSVYAPSDLNINWYHLQKEFIKKNTTIPYDFKVILNSVGGEIFNDDEIVRVNKNNEGHPAGVQQILEYMRERSNDYSGYLILDSDCFPAFRGWQTVLRKQMKGFNKSIAAPIRYENLDMFPHPCVVYMTPEGLRNKKINFNYTKVKNLLGETIEEVGGDMVNLMDEVLPMLRTNRVNLHPIAAGIYNHLFYHHGAGSRGFDFRLVKKYRYCEHWIDDDLHNMLGGKLFELLVKNPSSFVDKLMYGY